MARVSVFLITAALIVGMVGCGPVQYNLTISSTEGGDVTIPGEGTFTYDEGTVVNLVAEPDEDYIFIKWTGDVDTIANVYAATTTITMSGNYSITANFASATGIYNWYDLDAVRDNLGGNHALMNDLDSTTAGYADLASPTANGGKGWQPIGGWDARFTGSFDGRGYEIRNLFINRPDEDDVGLFGGVEDSGVIKNIGVTNATALGRDLVGGVAGFNGGTVTNSYSSSSVTGCIYYHVGGLVGGNEGTVTNSHSTGNVTGGGWVGGLVGTNIGTVSNSYSSSNVTSNGDLIGGLVGVNEGTVTNSYSTGNVTGNLGVGGLVGANGYADLGTVTNSFWDTETSGQSASDGGTGKTTTEMQDIATFSAWDIIAVADPGTRNPSYTWNIVNGVAYPFLSWQP